jgi:hypothetical protein
VLGQVSGAKVAEGQGVTKRSDGFSYPVASLRQCTQSLAARAAHGTLPEGPIDVYSWEEPVQVHGEGGVREIGSWRRYQWFARGEFPPDGARFEKRIVPGEHA